MMCKGTTNYKLLGAYVSKTIIGYSTIDFFFQKISLSLNIFCTREDSTVKNSNKKMFAGECFWKKNDCRGALIKKNVCRGQFLNPPPPSPFPPLQEK